MAWRMLLLQSIPRVVSKPIKMPRKSKISGSVSQLPFRETIPARTALFVVVPRPYSPSTPNRAYAFPEHEIVINQNIPIERNETACIIGIALPLVEDRSSGG